MSPERQLLLCAMRVAVITYKLNSNKSNTETNTESSNVDIRTIKMDKEKINEIADKYKHL
jgi:hypothetical protein